MNRRTNYFHWSRWLHRKHIKAHNEIFLLIGKKDTHHHALAKQFYAQAEGSSLNVTLIEYDGGHVIPQQLLQQVMQTPK